MEGTFHSSLAELSQMETLEVASSFASEALQPLTGMQGLESVSLMIERVAGVPEALQFDSSVLTYLMLEGGRAQSVRSPQYLSLTKNVLW